jgi:hypothetical protein
MFLLSNRKNRKKEKQEAEQKQRENILSRFDDALKDAALIEDPAKKAISLKGIEREIGDKISVTKAGISGKAANKGAWAMAATALSGFALCAAVVAGAIALGPVAPAIAPVVIIAYEALAFGSLFGGLLGCSFVSQKVSTTAHSRLTQEAQGFYSKLDEKKQAASALAEKTVTDNPQAIARSPLRADVLKLPRLMEVFSNVAADKMAVNDNTVAPGAIVAVNSRPSL